MMRTFHIIRSGRNSWQLIEDGPNWAVGISPGYADTGAILKTDATEDNKLYEEMIKQMEANDD
jgi:hypothetical protein